MILKYKILLNDGQFLSSYFLYAYAKCMLLLCLLLSEKEGQSFQTVVAKITAQTILIYKKEKRFKVAEYFEIATEVQQKCRCSPALRNVSSIFTSWVECFIVGAYFKKIICCWVDFPTKVNGEKY